MPEGPKYVFDDIIAAFELWMSPNSPYGHLSQTRRENVNVICEDLKTLAAAIEFHDFRKKFNKTYSLDELQFLAPLGLSETGLSEFEESKHCILYLLLQFNEGCYAYIDRK
jgi:hypothetical protein